MPEVIFYYAPGACSLAPHILLKEVGVPYEAISLRVGAIRNDFPESYRLINPKMRVPAISVDGNTITEVPAVATIIASLAPDLGLMGTTPLESARVYEWMNWISGTLHGQGFGQLFRPQRFLDEEAAFDKIKANGLKCIKDCFASIEGKLKGIHAVGEKFTAVDAYLLVFYRWGNTDVELNMKGEYPNYTALVSNLVQRPSVKATLEAENITSTL